MGHFNGLRISIQPLTNLGKLFLDIFLSFYKFKFINFFSRNQIFIKI
jgi:hypothetical protein